MDIDLKIIEVDRQPITFREKLKLESSNINLFFSEKNTDQAFIEEVTDLDLIKQMSILEYSNITFDNYEVVEFVQKDIIDINEDQNLFAQILVKDEDFIKDVTYYLYFFDNPKTGFYYQLSVMLLTPLNEDFKVDNLIFYFEAMKQNILEKGLEDLDK